MSPFNDPIGRDAVIQWPGGVDMQLYWHTTAPTYAPLTTVPENRIYVSPQRVAAFLNSFVAFSHGKVASDDAHAPGADIGKPDETFRRVRICSTFGVIALLVTDIPQYCLLFFFVAGAHGCGFRHGRRIPIENRAWSAMH